jgi:putative ATP-dependent endonuclease of the OLD family
MKIEKIKVENYRILKSFEIDLEKELSLVIGKNNTGKTSLLSILNKFLISQSKNQFSYEDFNLDFKQDLCLLVKNGLPESGFDEIGIKLRLIIGYSDTDNLSNINRVMMDLDPDNSHLVLGFDYVLDADRFQNLRSKYLEFVANEDSKHHKDNSYQVKGIDDFLKRYQGDYFNLIKKSILYDSNKNVPDESVFIDLEKEKISLKDILNFQYISAKREVSNKDVNKTLSIQTSKIYKKTEESDDTKEAVEIFKDKLSTTDSDLSEIYSSLFSDIIDIVEKFGGIKKGDSIIDVLSTLQHRDLLEGNTTVMYNHNGSNLPENYNGLGYMNLISMLFEIDIIIKEFKRTKDEKPADINFLFIEEPEAHTHPQMQYVFIKNIKELLRKGIVRTDNENRELQYIISTHSSHIVAESHFDDIKYLKKVGNCEVISKNLKSLEEEYKGENREQHFKFLKQYLTINRAELFFADKAILIEGDTERILLPAVMKKLDAEKPDNPLLSQNISIVEVGAYSHVFEKFIDFVGIRTLIITDIDSADNGRKQCKVSNDSAAISTNASIEYFIGTNLLNELIGKSKDERILKKCREQNKWVPDENGHLLVAYQNEEDGYHGRSFEDAFFNLNRDFITSEHNHFLSLKKSYLEKYKNEEIDVYEFAKDGVGSKASLAIEILLNSKKISNEETNNWKIPQYIKDSLIWLKED